MLSATVLGNLHQQISSFETQAMVAVSINEGICEAAGRTKTRGAPAPPALGPEQGVAPPPAAAPPPLHETPPEPRQTSAYHNMLVDANTGVLAQTQREGSVRVTGKIVRMR